MSQPRVLSSPVPTAQANADVVVIGAGACGLTAALKAHARGREVLIAERDAQPSGSTSMSAGFIPAAGTRYQAELGIDEVQELGYVIDKKNTRLSRISFCIATSS